MTELANIKSIDSDYEFDLVVSFAGEDRDYVDDFVRRCQADGYRVFYDEDQAADMWGEELTEYFAETYENRAKFAVMFISEHYARKPWTNHERRSILLRALEQGASNKGPYLLPIRIDDTKLRGVRSSIAFIDSREKTIEQIVEAVRAKLGNHSDSANRQEPLQLRTPRTPEECARLLAERPPYWEYRYTAYLFVEKIRTYDSALRDIRFGLFEPGDYIADDELINLSQLEAKKILKITSSFANLLESPAQVEAWGEPGEPGDPTNIEHFVVSYGRIIELLIAWANRVGSYTAQSDAGEDVLQSLRKYADQPIAASAKFVFDFRETADSFEAQLEDQDELRLTLPVTWDVPEEISSDFHEKLEQFAQHLTTSD